MALSVAFSLLLIALFSISSGEAAVHNVLNFGAIGNGKADDSQAFTKAWMAACGDSGYPVLSIPAGRTFLVSPIKFEGPCNSPSLQIQISGNIIAPVTVNEWSGCEGNSWLYFSTINGLTVGGSGRINGHGQPWWRSFIQPMSDSGCTRPTAMHFTKCNGLRLTGLTHFNSPKNHIGINQCDDVIISNLRIFAPGDSPNTDGIDISASSHVVIRDSVMQTGDDCVAINDGSSFINVTGVQCGPGHGISVGSLGQDGSYSRVENVQVSKCLFKGSQNGVRIKTWPGGKGYARSISFEQITFIDVENPIIIDQHYCDGEFHCGDKGSAVHISDVSYKHLHGSSTGKTAIHLDCSIMACTNILMNEVNIKSAVPGIQTSVLCNNVVGSSFATSPVVPCLLS